MSKERKRKTKRKWKKDQPGARYDKDYTFWSVFDDINQN